MTQQFNPKTGQRGIEWCDETVNAVGGCIHDCKWQMPDGTVVICYAEDLAENGLAKGGYPQGFKHHYWRPQQLKDLGKPNGRLIFLDSMSDLMGHVVPEEQVLQVLDVVRKSPQNIYMMLTKAPKRIMKFIDQMPPNLWVGFSSPPDWFMGKELNMGQKEAFVKTGLQVLREVKARGLVGWMSIEPLSWDISKLLDDHPLQWVVIGAGSNGRKYYQPEVENVQRLIDLFERTKTPMFFKGNLKTHATREEFPVSLPVHPALFRRHEMTLAHGWPKNPYFPLVESANVLKLSVSGQASFL